MSEFKLESLSFHDRDAIPREYTGEGDDLSPELEWRGVPPSTVELALICEDPDAPQTEPWVHWLLYKIPLSVTQLPRGIPNNENVETAPGTLQGKNSFGKNGYGGPLPPVGHGWHRYYFKLYALDEALSLPAGATKAEIWEAMRGHVVGEAELVGRYQREKEQKKAG